MSDIELLTGPTAGDLLRTAVAAGGGEVLSWRAREVDHQPGRGVTAGYRVSVRWPDGTVRQEHIAATTGRTVEGALVVSDGAERVWLWRFPHDPFLPGLRTATDSAAIARLLGRLGLGDGPVTVVVQAYRPGRRAVLALTSRGGRAYLKVVRPSRAATIHKRHRLLVAAGVPAPQSLGYTDDGIVALAALPGLTLCEVLRRTRQPTPAAGAILAMLDRLPQALMSHVDTGINATAGTREQAPGRSWLDRCAHYATVVGDALPDQAERARQLAQAIVTEAGRGPTVPVHGDLYEAQLLVHRGQLTGLLDVDTAGAGERLDDLGCLLAHLRVLARVDPRRAGGINRLGAHYLAVFSRTVDPADLRYRAAAVSMSLATGPHRVQEPDWPAATRHRLDLVEDWLTSARAV